MKPVRFILHSDSLRAALWAVARWTPTAVGVCAPYEVTSQTAIYRYKRSALVDFIIERPLFPSDWARADLAFLRIGRVPAMIGYCRPWSHCHTPACPSGGGFASVATEATPVETCHRHVSKSRLSNPFHLTPKKNRYSNEYRFFWWKVVDSNHRSHRRQIYSLFPLATRETFHIQLPA